MVTRIIERGQEDGELRSDVDSALLMLMFVGAVQLILQTQVLASFEAPAEFAERGEQIVVDVFLRGAQKA